ncbi:hypothetical protein T03_15300 [Trichinella britovi]|uniref:Uncharacterized protein n=1 Tax=Trichinella britovi TaxID=45882 RepID=A0A0V1CA58_TRIBR|nr:hypothetical protein T03_15300 [Trichinella britovi]
MRPESPSARKDVRLQAILRQQSYQPRTVDALHTAFPTTCAVCQIKDWRNGNNSSIIWHVLHLPSSRPQIRPVQTETTWLENTSFANSNGPEQTSANIRGTRHHKCTI